MAVYDPQVVPVHPPRLPQAPQPSISCVGLLHCAATNRTFRIPDVPATSSVAHIKQWYAANISEAATDPRSLVILHNAAPTEDSTQVWQLAQGQGQFAVTVAHQQKSPRSMLSLLVDSGLPIPPISLLISSDSTVLYVKQRVFEILNLPMALASAPPTTLILPPSLKPLQNELSLENCGVQNNVRLSLSFQQESAHPGNFQPHTSTTPTQPMQYARIQEIWADNSNTINNGVVGNTPQPVVRAKPSPPSHALLPSLLFEDEDDEEASALSEYLGSACSVGPTQANLGPNTCLPCNPNQGPSQKGRNRRRSRSPPADGSSALSQDQLQQLAQNFRTKMCRNGPVCKFGRNCWFAHNADELRKPSDPLPNNHLPAVHKLERYSHREANAAKDRHDA